MNKFELPLHLTYESLTESTLLDNCVYFGEEIEFVPVDELAQWVKETGISATFSQEKIVTKIPKISTPRSTWRLFILIENDAEALQFKLTWL
jgi:hypothetical protein